MAWDSLARPLGALSSKMLIPSAKSEALGPVKTHVLSDFGSVFGD